MARSSRPIDPPELPAWRKTGKAEEDETPTLTGLDGSDPFESEETQWEAVPPTDSVAARSAAVSPAGFMTASDISPATRGATDDTLSDPGSPPVLTPQPLGEAKEDPRALAQRLAAEAKARATSAPAPAPEPVPIEDPRDLARRLAAEAKAKLAATPAPAPPAAPSPVPEEDPRELAKRLAAEAKAERAATPAPQAALPPAPAEDPRELARRLAAEAKARIAATPAPAPQTAMPPPPSHLEKKMSRPRSAKEILEEALRAEAIREATPAPVSARARMPAPPPAPPPELAPVQQAAPAPVPQAVPAPAPVPQAAPAPAPVPQAAPAPAPAPSSPNAAVTLLELLPGAAVEAPMAIQRPEVFQAVWRAHRTRAVHEQDWSTVAAASVLVDAAARLHHGQLRQGAFVGCRVSLGGKPYAVFADIDRRCLLAILSPADVFLAGLGDPS